MAKKKAKPYPCMDLKQARRISRKPGGELYPTWERALRILVRWASEPCLKREYVIRKKQCVSVMQCLLRHDDMLERREQLKLQRFEDQLKRRKVKLWRSARTAIGRGTRTSLERVGPATNQSLKKSAKKQLRARS